MEVDFVMEPPWTQTTAPETSVFKVGNSHLVITAVIIIITIISITGITAIITRVYSNQNWIEKAFLILNLDYIWNCIVEL